MRWMSRLTWGWWWWISPGRVVTLIERSFWEKLGDHHEADDVVWGTAYRIPPEKVESVKAFATPPPPSHLRKTDG